jgi:hypothetical protein
VVGDDAVCVGSVDPILDFDMPAAPAPSSSAAATQRLCSASVALESRVLAEAGAAE